eukprot:430432_1
MGNTVGRINNQVNQINLFRANAVEIKRAPLSVAVVSGYIRELEKQLKESETLINQIPIDVYYLCLSYYSMTRHYKNKFNKYIQIRNSDRIKSENIFEFECSKYGLMVTEFEVSALAADQDWGNTGYDYFKLTIKKTNGTEKSIRLFSIDHNKHKGFYKYSMKYSQDKHSDTLGLIEASDKLIVSCHCAPYPGWEIKVKSAQINIVYEE